jgi:hypothetical protein
LVATPLAHAQIADGSALPRQAYFLAFDPFYRGEYRDALRGFRSAANSGINTGAGRWIDSICYFTMIGECLYHSGDLASAAQQYDAALELMIARRGWVERIQFPAIGPLLTTARVPWGPSTRNAVPGDFQNPMLSMQGTDVNAALQRGGVVAPQQLYPVHVAEILRCVGLSLRRRREILGPVAAEMPLTNQIVRELSRRQLPANHWAQALFDVPLGIAKATAGDRDEALELLQRSLVAGGRFDHPLTALALLEIGELALEKNELDLAQRSFFEASFPAVYFGQGDTLEEALVGAAKVHALKNEAGIFPPLLTAAEWCRGTNLDRASSALWLAAAEQSAIAGDPRPATRLLGQAQQAMRRSDLRNADLGVKLLYQNAQLAFETGDTSAGFKVLQDAYRLHRNHSRRLYQLDLTNRLYTSKELSPRVASLLLGTLLREPTQLDWQQQRYETLLFEATPHLPVLERWLEISLDRSTGSNMDTLVLVSETIRRHKFFAQLPLGGRLLALRWVLEAPEVLLNAETRNQRQNLLNKYSDLAAPSQQLDQLKVQLSQLPVVPEDADAAKNYERVAKDLVQTSDQLEQSLVRLALRPDPATRMFPPLLSLDEIQARLRDGQGILAFCSSGRSVHALLITSDKRYKTWLLKAPDQMRSKLTSLMREIGNYEQKQILPAERLTSSTWKETAAALFEPLAEGLTAETLGALQELVIVPDNFLWELPFELLQVEVAGQRKSLIDVVPLRYAPTLGLAVADARPKNSSGPRVIVQGRLFARETSEILAAAAEQLKDQHGQAVVVQRRLPYATRYVAPVWQQLVVLDDIEGVENDALGWSPAQIDQGKPGGALAEWLQLPWGAPDVIVLPGYHMAAEDGMRGQTDGDDVLIASCGLMAAGSRTVVLSRWRTGGRTSMELVREFLPELPERSAAAAWQRSVLLARSGELDPSAEPRLKNVQPGEVPTADHPFFWAGFLVMGAW